MKVTITSLGGRAPPVRKRRCLAQDLIRAFQLEVLFLELLQVGALVGGQARTFARVALRLPDPPAQRFHRAAQFLSDRSNRRPLGRVLVRMVEDHPDGAFTQFWGVLAGS
jgi:hypothetical protein